MPIDVTTNTCEYCGGTGAVRGACPLCKGTGIFCKYEEVPPSGWDEHRSTTFLQLRSIRESREVSLRDLAEHLHITIPQLSDIERGRLEPVGELKSLIQEWQEQEWNG